jgi:hypothetical protein
LSPASPRRARAPVDGASPRAHDPLARALLHGVDFTSSPSRRKPIVVASGRPHGRGVRLERIERIPDLAGFEAFLARPGPWLGVFDLPFGLPREFVLDQGWPPDHAAVAAVVAAAGRPALRARFAAYCDARPAGRKFARRATDGPAGSSPSMKWVNPPVAWMYEAGVPRLLAAGVDMPALARGDPSRVALEGYPGLLARSFGRISYKSDERARQSPERESARRRLVEALRAGRLRLGVAVEMDDERADGMAAEPSADALDAALCLSAAGWAWRRRARRFGLPDAVDPLEGWIGGADDPLSTTSAGRGPSRR